LDITQPKSFSLWVWTQLCYTNQSLLWHISNAELNPSILKCILNNFTFVCESIITSIILSLEWKFYQFYGPFLGSFVWAMWHACHPSSSLLQPWKGLTIHACAPSPVTHFNVDLHLYAQLWSFIWVIFPSYHLSILPYVNVCAKCYGKKGRPIPLR